MAWRGIPKKLTSCCLPQDSNQDNLARGTTLPSSPPRSAHTKQVAPTAYQLTARPCPLCRSACLNQNALGRVIEVDLDGICKAVDFMFTRSEIPCRGFQRPRQAAAWPSKMCLVMALGNYGVHHFQDGLYKKDGPVTQLSKSRIMQCMKTSFFSVFVFRALNLTSSGAYSHSCIGHVA